MVEAAARASFPAIGLVDPAPIPFERLNGLADDDLLDAWAAFRASCARAVADGPALRPGLPPLAAWKAACAEALALAPSGADDVLGFFARRFRAHRVRPGADAARGFMTGYYEPVLAGAWTRSADFAAPLLARPPDLVTLRPGDDWGGLDRRLSGGRRRDAAGALLPYPARAAIEAAGETPLFRPLLFVRDPIEAFMIQVQGSATIRIGSDLVRLTYAGRNGRPYTSIGRILIERGDIAPADMSLARLKQWARDRGQAPGEAGRELLWRNESFVFFDIDRSPDRTRGPIGAAGVPLRPLRSIAVDRTLWPYGLPFWVDARLPWRGAGEEPFQRLTIAQDTGSAIVGPSRADLYVGVGDTAGAIAGDIRHPADFHVFLPIEADEAGR